MKTKLLSLVAFGFAAAACAASSGGTDSGDQDITSTTPHDVFSCDLSSGGGGATGTDFTLTLGTGSITIESSKIGSHSGTLEAKAPGVPSTSERYLISGLVDSGNFGIVIPKNLRNDTKATVHVDSTDGTAANDFLCKPVITAPTDDAGPASASGVKGTLNVSCDMVPDNSGSVFFGETVNLVLQGDTLSVKNDIEDSSGPFDPTFKPTTNTSFVRYLVPHLFDTDSTDVLVAKTILTGAGGQIKIEAKGDEFISTTYNCK